MTHKSLLITGASRGLGRMVAELASRRPDFTVLPVSRQAKPEWWGGEHWVAADVSTERGARNAVSAYSEVTRETDFAILFNNAGHYVSKPIAEIDDQLLEQSFRSNFLTVFNATKEFCDRFERGRVVVILGANAYTSSPKSAAYGTVKIAIDRLLQSFRMEFATKKIQFCKVSSGSINTWSQEPVEGAADSAEVAALLLDTFSTETFCVQDIRLDPT